MIHLGKWPTLRVVGEPVTEAEASRILVSTFSWWGAFANDKDWLGQVRAIAGEFGMPVEPLRDDFGSHDEYVKHAFRVWLPAFTTWTEEHGVLTTISPDSIGNDRITGTYRAWCHWDGLIEGQYSVGKDPGEDEILDEWEQIARLHPGLVLTADLISEHDDCRGDTSNPEGYTAAYRYHVANGMVRMEQSLSFEPLVLSDEYMHRAHNEDRMSSRGTTPERLRQAFRDLVGAR